ncbi:MAG: nucleotide exchange factor GrpE [Candidatus Pacearchaeota archaeon]
MGEKNSIKEKTKKTEKTTKKLDEDIQEGRTKEKYVFDNKDTDKIEETENIESLKKQISELRMELDEARKLAEERLNQIKYLQADFENYKKQLNKEKEEIIKLANETLIRELIVILDDFDAAIKLSSNEENKKGMLQLKNKFFDILSNQGLKEIEALGKKFNPEFHEVLCKEISEHNEDEIIEEIQKGYMLKSKVLRASKVKISKKIDNKNLED